MKEEKIVTGYAVEARYQTVKNSKEETLIDFEDGTSLVFRGDCTDKVSIGDKISVEADL